jgi:hypothetical protein
LYGAEVIVKFSELPLKINSHTFFMLSLEQFSGVGGFSITFGVK